MKPDAPLLFALGLLFGFGFVVSAAAVIVALSSGSGHLSRHIEAAKRPGVAGGGA